MNFTHVIKGTEDCRQNSLHIPEVEEFVGNRRKDLPVTGLRHEIIFADSDSSRIQMFDAIGSLWLNFEQEDVLFVGKFSEDSHRRFHDVLNVGRNLRRAH